MPTNYRRSVVFVISPTANPDGGSTVLRGRQLHDLAKPILREAGYSSDVVSHSQVWGSLVILNKNLILNTSADVVRRFQVQDCLVAVDPLDGQISKDVLEASDVLIASSKRQTAYFSETFPRKPAYYIGHHVDLRIGQIDPPIDRLCVGYFGENYNAAHADCLSDRIDFHRTNTGTASDTSWMSMLNRYNAHYSVRRTQEFDGHKPFTKGFIAAHCGAPIIVSRSDQEARSFLSEDYPYFLDDVSLAGVREAIDRLKSDFGGPIWRRAQVAMHLVRKESSRPMIAAQVLAAVNAAAAL